MKHTEEFLQNRIHSLEICIREIESRIRIYELDISTLKQEQHEKAEMLMEFEKELEQVKQMENA